MKSLLLIESLQQGVIEGRKTQTRRLISSDNIVEGEMDKPEIIQLLINAHAQYRKNEIIYLKEGFRVPSLLDEVPPSQIKSSPVEYKLGGTINCIGDHISDPGRWRSPMHMPADLARTFLKVTDVKVERLWSISTADANEEGVGYMDDVFHGRMYMDYIKGSFSKWMRSPNSFKSLWISLYSEEAWEKNPWVFVYSFKRCQRDGTDLVNEETRKEVAV